MFVGVDMMDVFVGVDMMDVFVCADGFVCVDAII